MRGGGGLGPVYLTRLLAFVGIFPEKLINPKSYMSATDLSLLNVVSGFTEADPGANLKGPNFPKFSQKTA